MHLMIGPDEESSSGDNSEDSPGCHWFPTIVLADYQQLQAVRHASPPGWWMRMVPIVRQCVHCVEVPG